MNKVNPRKRSHKSWYKLTTAEFDRELEAMTDEDRQICQPSPRKPYVLSWSNDRGSEEAPAIRILTAPNFSAQGMRLVYGRSDNWPRLSCGLDIFLRKDGRLFVRFHSPGKRVTYRSYELLGLKLPPPTGPGEMLDENCVPQLLRSLYEDWVVECIQYPDDID